MDMPPGLSIRLGARWPRLREATHARERGCEIQLRPHVGGHRSFWKEEIAPLFLEALRRNIEFSCARRSLLFSRGPGSIPRSWDPGMQSWAWAS